MASALTTHTETPRRALFAPMLRARRDTNPKEWYPHGPVGTVQKFNKLPAAYQGNVNTTEAPYNRQPGMAPTQSAAEIEDLSQVLGTLTDDYPTK